MTRLRPVLPFFMCLLALCTGFATVKPQPCFRVSPLWMQGSHRFTHRKPCAVAYFQVDDTALEFEEDETPLSDNMDKIKRMVCFLWTRSAVALLHASQRSHLQTSEHVSRGSTSEALRSRKEEEVTTEDAIEGAESIKTEMVPDRSEEKTLDQNKAQDDIKGDLKSSDNESPSLALDREMTKVPENNDEVEQSVGPNKEEEATTDSERPSTMHKKEGDRVIALQDEFLDPLPEAISLDFGRPLEIIKAGIPPLREKSNPASSSK